MKDRPSAREQCEKRTNTQDRIGGKGRRGISLHPLYLISNVGTMELELRKVDLLIVIFSLEAY